MQRNFQRGIRRVVTCAAFGLCFLFAGSPSVAQQSSGLTGLAEELLKRLENPDGETSTPAQGNAQGGPAATDPLIPPPARVGADESRLNDLPPTIAATPPPPLTGPEADLARRLLALTDTEETQADER